MTRPYDSIVPQTVASYDMLHDEMGKLVGRRTSILQADQRLEERIVERMPIEHLCFELATHDVPCTVCANGDRGPNGVMVCDHADVERRERWTARMCMQLDVRASCTQGSGSFSVQASGGIEEALLQ